MRLRDRLQSEDFHCARSHFLDEFRANPCTEMVADSVLDLPNLSIVQKSYIAATVDELCGECKVPRPDWIFDPCTYLDHPVFAMDAKGPLRIILLQESPKWYRSRNLFVSSNCSTRV